MKEEHIVEDEIQPASSGESMVPFVDWIRRYSTLVPINIFEIGANLGQDAEVLRREFGLDAKQVWVFEPHPDCYRYIREHHDFNAFDIAISNIDGVGNFNAIDIKKNNNSGISSLLRDTLREDDSFRKINVLTSRMDTFMCVREIRSVGFLKLDAEGFNYEILEGFGSRLADVNCVHVEAEHEEIWVGQRTYDDIADLLRNNGFELVFFQRYMSQSDSFWVQRKYIKTEKESRI
ncbi:MAG: FkbM family methyltransferase [Candidatus Moranbacteria bacterium]|nr:FkbM family methyltransferase [Candidatus Moranbacteria bacterium]